MARCSHVSFNHCSEMYSRAEERKRRRKLTRSVLGPGPCLSLLEHSFPAVSRCRGRLQPHFFGRLHF